MVRRKNLCRWDVSGTCSDNDAFQPLFPQPTGVSLPCLTSVKRQNKPAIFLLTSNRNCLLPSRKTISTICRAAFLSIISIKHCSGHPLTLARPTLYGENELKLL